MAKPYINHHEHAAGSYRVFAPQGDTLITRDLRYLTRKVSAIENFVFH